MGTFTRSEFRAELDANLGNRAANLPTQDQTLLYARYDRQLNLTPVRIARKHNFTELNRLDRVQFTPTGVPLNDRYFSSFPANTKEIFSLIWQEGEVATTTDVGAKVIEIPNKQFDLLIGTSWTGATGIPAYYTRRASQGALLHLEWYPVPNAQGVLNRYYSLWHTPIASDV